MEGAPHLILKRDWILDAGAFGSLAFAGIPFAVTLERTYPGQREGSNVVKIPPGRYKLQRRRYNRGGYETWQVIGGEVTEDRVILIHKGNAEEDSEGCILIGEQYDPFNGKPGILQSGKAFAELMMLTADYDQLDLLVMNT